MSNRDDWENVAIEIAGLGRARLVTELHNAFVAGQESVDEHGPKRAIDVLRSVEWKGREDYVGDGGYDCCPSCGGIAPADVGCWDALSDVAKGRNVVGHKPECKLAAVLQSSDAGEEP